MHIWYFLLSWFAISHFGRSCQIHTNQFAYGKADLCSYCLDTEPWYLYWDTLYTGLMKMFPSNLKCLIYIKSIFEYIILRIYHHERSCCCCNSGIQCSFQKVIYNALWIYRGNVSLKISRKTPIAHPSVQYIECRSWMISLAEVVSS